MSGGQVSGVIRVCGSLDGLRVLSFLEDVTLGHEWALDLGFFEQSESL